MREANKCLAASAVRVLENGKDCDTRRIVSKTVREGFESEEWVNVKEVVQIGCKTKTSLMGPCSILFLRHLEKRTKIAQGERWYTQRGESCSIGRAVKASTWCWPATGSSRLLARKVG